MLAFCSRCAIFDLMADRFEYQKVKLELARRGLKLGWVAKELGVHSGTVSRWINGHSMPDGPALIAIARLLEMRPEDLIAS